MIVQESEAEYNRRGGFERLFPRSDPKENDYYLRFFEEARYENALLTEWER